MKVFWDKGIIGEYIRFEILNDKKYTEFVCFPRMFFIYGVILHFCL